MEAVSEDWDACAGRKGKPMKLVENEERALKRLREELFARYLIIDFRLCGSKARGEGRPGLMVQSC